MMQDDSHKRPFEANETQEPKRMRPEEILGAPEKLTSRILMSRQEFSKVIGKAGATIMHIRNTCGAFIKGFDIDAESRLVIISGTLRQILEGFEMVSELAHQVYSQTAPTENFSIQLLLENGKAGRVVGQKGVMIQNLKAKSGAVQMKMQKDIKDISGVQLRVLTMEGQLAAVRRAHYFVLELFADPSQIASLGGAPGGYEQHIQAAPGGGGNFSMHGGGGSPQMSATAYSPHSSSGAPLHLSSLTTLGVQAETVRQLSEMKAYLSRQFGLDLSISREGSSMSAPTGGSYGTPFAMGGGVAGPVSTPRPHNPDEVSHSFVIPRATVGGIIGKAGQVLKDLQTEFGLRIYVEKEEVAAGMRTVILKTRTVAGAPSTGGVATAADKDAFFRCQERITAMTQDPSILSPIVVGSN